MHLPGVVNSGSNSEPPVVILWAHQGLRPRECQ